MNREQTLSFKCGQVSLAMSDAPAHIRKSNLGLQLRANISHGLTARMQHCSRERVTLQRGRDDANSPRRVGACAGALLY